MIRVRIIADTDEPVLNPERPARFLSRQRRIRNRAWRNTDIRLSIFRLGRLSVRPGTLPARAHRGSCTVQLVERR